MWVHTSGSRCAYRLNASGRSGARARGDIPYPVPRRIRLVAYGARLESVLGATPREFESRILRHADQPERAADRYRRPRVVVPATVGRYGPTGRLRRSAAASPRTDAGSARPQRDPGSRTTTRDIGRRCHGGRSTHSPARARNLRHRSARPRQSTPRRPLRRSRYEQHGSCSRCGAGQGTSEVVPGCRTRWCGRPCRPGVRVGRVPVMASEAVGRRCAPVCSCVGEAASE